MHPDLSQEVATLSTKLIDAINHQTKLDDNLQHTRHELEAARERLAKLELQVKVHEQKVAKGLLVEKEVYDKMEKQLLSDLHEEKRRRADAEKAKRKTDNEVETLTAALFEEANVVSFASCTTRASLTSSPDGSCRAKRDGGIGEAQRPAKAAAQRYRSASNIITRTVARPEGGNGEDECPR